MSEAFQRRVSTQLSTPSPLDPAAEAISPLDFTDRIPFEELQLSKETLGSGSFGTVYKGTWRGHMVAVKQFRTREEIDSFLVEVKQLSCVKHPNIVTLYGASTLSDTAYLVMEYAERGSLNHLLHECRNQNYDIRHACSWALQTARGVAYLHEMRPKPIMHRDLKPANLLLFSRGKTLKICDFGTACTVKTQMTSNTGSACYMAPEVFATSSYLESGDVFSWSIIFWEILARDHPYSQQYSNPYQILWRVKQEGARPNKLVDCPEIIWSLIEKCWDKDPRMRPSMRQVATEMEIIFSLTTLRLKPGVHKSLSQSTQLHLFSLCFLTELKAAERSHPKSASTISMPTGSSSSKSVTGLNRRLLHYNALASRLELLRKRAEELESLSDCKIKLTANESFKNFTESKRITELKKEELRDKRSALVQRYNSGTNQCPNFGQ